MLEQPADPPAAELAQRALRRRVVQQVAALVPERHVDVGAAADLVEEGLGREAGAVAMAQCDPPHRVAHLDLRVRRGQRRRVAHRDLQLPAAVLVHRQLGGDPLGRQRVDRLQHHGVVLVEPDRAVHRQPLGLHVAAVGRAPVQVVLVLERRLHGEPGIRRGGDLPAQQRSRAPEPRLPGAVEQAGDHRPAGLDPGQHRERRRVRHQPHLVHRRHLGDVDQLVADVQRRLRQGHPDALGQLALEVRPVHDLGADDPGVVAVQEADEPDVRVVDLLQHSLDHDRGLWHDPQRDVRPHARSARPPRRHPRRFGRRAAGGGRRHRGARRRLRRARLGRAGQPLLRAQGGRRRTHRDALRAHGRARVHRPARRGRGLRADWRRSATTTTAWWSTSTC